MATCVEVVKHYKNLPGQNVQELWLQISKRGMKMDQLRDILMFYIYHKTFPPPLQKSFELLIQNMQVKGTSRKMRNMILQILEEISTCMESNVVETLSDSGAVELLSCILVGGLVPLLDQMAIGKLFSLLQSSELSCGERGKLLAFLCQTSGSSSERSSELSSHMSHWLRQRHSPAPSSTPFFSRSDSSGGTEVDGTTAGDQFTVLTLASSASDGYMMGTYTFGVLRDWLGRISPEQCGPLGEAVREYCSLVVEQSFRPAHKEVDAALQKAVLCEVLDILNQLVQLDKSQGSQSLLVVKRIQNNITEKFKADYRDVCIFVRVLNFLLNFGETTGYNSQLFCENFLGDIVYRSYSSGLAAFDIATFLVDSRVPSPLLQRFFPNLLKLVACHPATLIEEFLVLTPSFVAPHTAVEVFHSLVDLPVLSATLCLHQAPAVLQLDSSGSPDVPWLSLVDGVRSSTFRPVFSHLLRQESGQEVILNRLPSYLELLKELSNHMLVITCSRIVPLLLDSFFGEVERRADTRMLADTLLALLSRLRLIFDVPDYRTAIHRCVTRHIRTILKLCPRLVFLVQKELIEYISMLNNSDVCPDLYTHVLWAIGEYASPGYSDTCSHDQLVKYFEAVECVLFESLTVVPVQGIVYLKFLNIMCAALAKLASRCPDFIPRTVLCLGKVRAQVAAGLPDTLPEDKKIVFDRIEELLCLLRNPNIAAVILSSSHEHNPAISAVLRVLAQFTDS
ncbi:AP-5 complex subunit zeta-1 [Anabrus simplex]|uniref:AP-5 complex subunit zeta-1 n=1 Tax=Anabrus simplex TaxID=316456 RepID=UPI0035A34302